MLDDFVEPQKSFNKQARKNFGNGSSREHAVWALDDFGFRCVIAESFADIFYNNCSKNGVLPVCLQPEEVELIHKLVAKHEGFQLTIDLKKKTVSDGSQFNATFEIDDYRRQCFLEGLDHIALTLQHLDKIEEFENTRNMYSQVAFHLRPLHNAVLPKHSCQTYAVLNFTNPIHRRDTGKRL